MVRRIGLLGAIVFAVTLGDFDDCAHGAAAGKRGDDRRPGTAAEQMGTKGGTNPNAQWSADPDRGWVRAEDRHQMTNEAAHEHKNKGKARGKKF